MCKFFACALVIFFSTVACKQRDDESSGSNLAAAQQKQPGELGCVCESTDGQSWRVFRHFAEAPKQVIAPPPNQPGVEIRACVLLKKKNCQFSF